MTVEEDVDRLLQNDKHKVVKKHFKFNKRNFLICFGSFIISALLVTMLVLPVSREWMQSFGVREETVSAFGDEPFNSTLNLGYELLDNNTVLHIWNTQDNYYFNVSNGIQFSNHYNEYWTHNVLILGYYSGDAWNLIYRTDELSGFNRNLSGETDSYLNATLWKDLSYGSYDFRLAIRYYLGVNDSDLTIIPYIKNLGVAIPYVLGFGWELKDIKIGNTYENDQIRINETSYLLNQTLDIKYTNITKTIYEYNETTNETTNYTIPNPVFNLDNLNNGSINKTLYLKWNPELDYLVWVKSRDDQYNAVVVLFIKIGILDIDQEKSTELHWHDATLIDSYSEDNQNTTLGLTDHHPSDTTSSSAGGQSFTCSETINIHSVKFDLQKLGSPTGMAHAVLYAHSGTYGASSVPTGDALATSDDLDVSGLPGILALVTLSFTGGERYEMQVDTKYCIVLEAPTTGDIDAINYPAMGRDSTSPTHDGNALRYVNGAWAALATNDMPFYVYGEAVAPPSRTWQDIGSMYWNVSFSNTSLHRDIGSLDYNISFGNLTTDEDIGNMNYNISFGNLILNEDIGSMDFNVSFGNLTVDTTIGGMNYNISFGNLTVNRDIGNLDYNVSFGNLTVDEDIGTLDFNISFGNDTTDRNIGSLDYNISFGNLTLNKDVGNMDYNVSFGNSSAARVWFDVGDLNFNISFGNDTSNEDVGNMDYNISFGNLTTDEDISNMNYNISFGNLTLDENIGSMDYNISFGNSSAALAWYPIGNMYWVVSFSNSSPPTLNISVEYPNNNSNIQDTQPMVYFNLTSPQGYVMNYSIYIGNGTGNCITLLHSEVNVSNGTQRGSEHFYYNAIGHYEEYYWRVMVGDGYNYINETYSFEAILQGGGNIPTNNANVVMGVVGGLMGGLIGALMFIRKRRKNENN